MLRLLAALIAPTAFWAGYLRYKDRYQPEPLQWMGLAYVLGLVAGWVGLRGYLLLEALGLPADPLAFAAVGRLPFLAYCIVVVGLLEEAVKLLPFLLVVPRLRYFDEMLDGIIYASCIALGFATYENLLYLPLLDGFALWGRAVASPLTHTVFASIWGFTVASALLRGRRLLPAALQGLFLAALLHGLYDYFTLDPRLRLGAALLILVIWIWRIRTIDQLHRLSRRGGAALPRQGGPAGAPEEGDPA
ncbi:MAG: PrsW family intramembrane metalloprotease [Acidobacteriota bacterium]